MELRQLATFQMVATMLSFSRAATALNYVQSSVTTQIQILEEELGVQLFDRLGKRVALTDAGKRLLIYCDKILDLVNEARSAVPGDTEVAGTVTISAAESLCTYRLPAILQKFNRSFPQSRVVFRPYTGDLRRAVNDGIVDVGFILDHPLQSSSLIVEPLLHERILLLASPDHPLTARTPICTEILQGERFLLTEKGCSYRNPFERVLNETGIDAITDLEFTSIEAIKQCAIAGMGMAFLPEMTVRSEIEQHKLVELQWEGHTFQATMQMLWHKEKWLSPAIAAFLDITREVLTPEQVPVQV